MSRHYAFFSRSLVDWLFSGVLFFLTFSVVSYVLYISKYLDVNRIQKNGAQLIQLFGLLTISIYFFISTLINISLLERTIHTRMVERTPIPIGSPLIWGVSRRPLPWTLLPVKNFEQEVVTGGASLRPRSRECGLRCRIRRV